MLMVGDKIRMVKQVPGIPMIEGSLEVTMMGNDSITIRGDAGYGMMSYQEYTNFFEKCSSEAQNRQEKCEQPPKRVWTDWIRDPYYGGYYKHNGKIVRYKIDGVKSKASCSPEDEFNLFKGKRIAYRRCQMKLHKMGLEFAKFDLVQLTS